MKKVRLYESFHDIDEAKLSKIHNAAKKGSYPVTLVVIENGKVVKQELVGTPQIVPAAFNQLKKEYPKATVHVEDKGGQTLFVEGLELDKEFNTNLNEAAGPGQWVAYISYPKGKKLEKVLKSHRAAVMWNNKNVDSILMQDGVEGVGIMSKEMWDQNEAEYAINQ